MKINKQINLKSDIKCCFRKFIFKNYLFIGYFLHMITMCGCENEIGIINYNNYNNKYNLLSYFYIHGHIIDDGTKLLRSFDKKC